MHTHSQRGALCAQCIVLGTDADARQSMEETHANIPVRQYGREGSWLMHTHKHFHGQLKATRPIYDANIWEGSGGSWSIWKLAHA